MWRPSTDVAQGKSRRQTTLAMIPTIIVEQLSQAVCDAFWKQEMSPWSKAPPGLRNLTFSHCLGSTHSECRRDNSNEPF